MLGQRPLVEVAGRAETPRLATVLARAFHDDPVMRWLAREDDQRSHGLEVLYRFILDSHGFVNGEVTRTSDFAGCAVWLAPNRWRLHLPWWRRLALLPQMLEVSGASRVHRLLGGLAQMEAVHPSEPHWYLGFLGVEPSRQGQGLGGALLRHKLDTLDAQGVAAYLESSHERNVGLYERHGFVVQGEVRLVGGPLVWPMWRAPR